MNEIIDDNVKAYLVACLVSGIHVEDNPNKFMTGLVEHMNELKDRIYWAIGDQDGVILHDKYDVPVMSLIYDGATLKFSVFEQDNFIDTGMQKDAGFMLLNILNYIRERNLACEPEVAYRAAKMHASAQTDQDDWSL